MPNNAETNNQSTELAVMPPAPPEALGVFRDPDIVLEEARKAARALMQVVESKKRGVRFNGETYLEYEDWQTLGRFYSMTPIVKSTREVEYGEVRGWEATAEVLLVPTNQVISSADAMCLDDEPNWSKKPLFQLRSMAQTRACAKALRNVLAWVVVLAGYKPTPGEEMGAGERVTKTLPRPPARKITPKPEPKPVEVKPEKPLTFAVKFWTAARQTGKKDQEIRQYLGWMGYEHTADVPKNKQQEALDWAASG